LEIIRIYTLLVVDVTDEGSGSIAAGHPASTHLEKDRNCRMLHVYIIHSCNWSQPYCIRSKMDENAIYGNTMQSALILKARTRKRARNRSSAPCRQEQTGSVSPIHPCRFSAPDIGAAVEATGVKDFGCADAQM
jgi:hypothetical protein